jgi:hypothetical protein
MEYVTDAHNDLLQVPPGTIAATGAVVGPDRWHVQATPPAAGTSN